MLSANLMMGLADPFGCTISNFIFPFLVGEVRIDNKYLVPPPRGCSGGSKGDAPGACPLPPIKAQNVLNFMQFFWKFWQNRMLAPPGGLDFH